jgi:hypothetical protein
MLCRDYVNDFITTDRREEFENLYWVCWDISKAPAPRTLHQHSIQLLIDIVINKIVDKQTFPVYFAACALMDTTGVPVPLQYYTKKGL